jgi:ORF061
MTAQILHNDIPLLLAMLYGVLVIVGYIPALISLIKDKSLNGVSSSFWYLISITVGISFYNIILTGGTRFQVISLFLNFFLGVICLLVLNYRKFKFHGIIYTIMFLLALYLFLGLLTSIEITQTVASVSIVLAYVGQIYKFVKSKSSSGTNKWLYLLIGVGLLSLITSMVLTDVSNHIIITELINFILILICYFMSNYYYKSGVDISERRSK